MTAGGLREQVTVITRQVVKRCPYVDEDDVGELVITIPGDAPELHDLGRHISKLMAVANTHEAFTRRVADLVPSAEVVTRWHTGPWDVECRVEAVKVSEDGTA